MDYVFLNAVWVLPFLGAVTSLPIGVNHKRSAAFISAIFLGFSALISTYALYAVYTGGFRPVLTSIAWFSFGGSKVSVGMLADGLSTMMSLLVAWLSFSIAVYSYEYMEGDPGTHRYWFFFDFFVGSMLLLVLADNLVLLLVGWEGTTLSSYALIGHWYSDEKDRWVGDEGRYSLGVPNWSTPSNSGVRAIVFTSFADIGFIIGIGMLYHAAGTLSVYAISQHMPLILSSLGKEGMLIPFLFLFSLGAFAKSAQFPFHEWLVTAMTGPTSVSALIHAATMVNAGVYFMLRFMPMVIYGAHVDGLFSAVQPFFLYVAVIGAFTAFMMASQALVSNELKLILAFSTASQLGYMFLAVGLSAYTVPSVAFFAAFSHMISQALFKAALFLAAGALIHEFSSRYIKDMGGAWHGMKWTTVAFLFAALSLSGVPPFSGFWDKDLILDLAFESGVWPLYLLAVAGAFMTAFYIFRAFMIAFAGPVKKEAEEPGRPMLLPYLALGLITLLFGVVWPYPVALGKSMYLVLSEDSPVRLSVPALPAFNAYSLAISLIMAFAGLGLAVYLYAHEREVIRTSGAGPISWLHSFLYDRWFINSIYYRAIVGSFSGLARAAELVERGGFDAFYNYTVPSAFGALSVRLRRIQGGPISKYVSALFAGLILMAVIYALVLLVR